MSDEELKTILELPLLVVLDEAYVEFAREPSRFEWVSKYENLIVLRTFSKRAGKKCCVLFFSVHYHIDEFWDPTFSTFGLKTEIDRCY